MVRRHARGQPVQPFGFVQVAAAQRELRLDDVGGELIGIQPGRLAQRGLRFVIAAAAHQHAGTGQVQLGVVRRQGDGAVDAGQRGIGLAVLQLGGGQPAQRLRVIGAFGGQRLRGSQGVGHGATAQGIEDRVVHRDYQVRANAHCNGAS